MDMEPKRRHLERVLTAYNENGESEKLIYEENNLEEMFAEESDKSGGGGSTWIHPLQPILLGSYLCLVHGAGDTTIPYLSVYYKQLGLDVRRIGILGSVQSWVAILWTPLIGYLTDKFSFRKFVLAASLVSAAVSHMALNFVPEVTKVNCISLPEKCADASTRFQSTNVAMQEDGLQDQSHIDNGSTHIPRQDLNLSYDCLHQVLKYRTLLYNKEDLQQVFIYLIFMNIICQLLGAAWYPLGNAEVLDALGSEKRNKYAYFKGLAGVSSALCIWIVGLLLQETTYIVAICGINLTNVNYLVCFAAFTFMMLLAVPVALAMSPNKTEGTTKEYHFVEVLRSLCNLRYGSVVLTITWLSIANGKMRTFDFWYIEVLGGSHSLMAWGGLIGQSTKIVTFFVLPGVNDRFGHLPFLVLACAATGLGCCISAFIKNAAWMIITLMIREMALAMYIQAAGTYLAEAIESHQMATMQTIMAALTFGLGRGVGSVLGGGLFQAISPAESYYIFALVSFAMGLFLFFSHVLVEIFSK